MNKNIYKVALLFISSIMLVSSDSCTQTEEDDSLGYSDGTYNWRSSGVGVNDGSNDPYNRYEDDNPYNRKSRDRNDEDDNGGLSDVFSPDTWNQYNNSSNAGNGSVTHEVAPPRSNRTLNANYCSENDLRELYEHNDRVAKSLTYRAKFFPYQEDPNYSNYGGINLHYQLHYVFKLAHPTDDDACIHVTLHFAYNKDRRGYKKPEGYYFQAYKAGQNSFRKIGNPGTQTQQFIDIVKSKIGPYQNGRTDWITPQDWSDIVNFELFQYSYQHFEGNS